MTTTFPPYLLGAGDADPQLADESIGQSRPSTSGSADPEPELTHVVGPRRAHPDTERSGAPPRGRIDGVETRPPVMQQTYTLRPWPQQPPMSGLHGVVGDPQPVGRGDMDPTKIEPKRPIRRHEPGSWDEPLFRV